jgi:hypothetical protein
VLKVGDEDEPWSLVLSMCIACSSTEGVLHSNHSTTIIDRTDKLGLSGLSRNGPVLLQPAAEKGPELLQPVLVVHERLRQAAKAEADALDDLRIVTPQLQRSAAQVCRKAFWTRLACTQSAPTQCSAAVGNAVDRRSHC